MKLSLVVPFVDTWDITKRCLEKINENSDPDTEVWLIDNGSEKSYHEEALSILSNWDKKAGRLNSVHYHRNKENTGVLPTFKQALHLASGDIICFIHSDVLLQESGWDDMVKSAFAMNEKIGLMGLFGAVGVGDNGGRVRSQSNMQGIEWGKCDCHDVAWKHHSEHITGISPATILDGVGMFFRRKALQDLIDTDMFDDWRAPHHFYDRIMPLKLINKGWKIATIGVAFDHASGQTANTSESWRKLAQKWCEDHHVPTTGAPDHDLYLEAEQQFFTEFGHRIPCTVDSNWDYHWTGVE